MDIIKILASIVVGFFGPFLFFATYTHYLGLPDDWYVAGGIFGLFSATMLFRFIISEDNDNISGVYEDELEPSLIKVPLNQPLPFDDKRASFLGVESANKSCKKNSRFTGLRNFATFLSASVTLISVIMEITDLIASQWTKPALVSSSLISLIFIIQRNRDE